MNVSVVIPSYNAEAWITEALDSVFNQTLQPTDVVVVDDASTDATADRVTEAAKGAPVPVQLLCLASNAGSPASPLNIGVAAAQGDVIAVLDHDDVLLPTKLEHQARVLEADPQIALVFSLFGDYNATSKQRELAVARARVRRLQRRMIPRAGYFECSGSVALEEFARSVNYVGGFPGFVFRRSAWDARGGFDEGLPVAADYDFLCWLCTQGSVAFVPEIHYRRREHDANLTTRSGIQWRIDAVDVMSQYLDVAAPGTRHIITRSMSRLLSKMAMRLGSSGHWSAAREVCATIDLLDDNPWRRRTRRPLIHLYAAYFRLRRTPWTIGSEQAAQAVEQAHRLAPKLT